MGSLAGRANLRIVWLYAIAILAPGAASFAAGNEPVRPEIAGDFPVASEVKTRGRSESDPLHSRSRQEDRYSRLSAN